MYVMCDVTLPGNINTKTDHLLYVVWLVGCRLGVVVIVAFALGIENVAVAAGALFEPRPATASDAAARSFVAVATSFQLLRVVTSQRHRQRAGRPPSRLRHRPRRRSTCRRPTTADAADCPRRRPDAGPRSVAGARTSPAAQRLRTASASTSVDRVPAVEHL